ncbi:zinc-binding dehydrogenase [Streptomyces sp. NPDC098781]|uniref:zinc-binding dehydrogenase n=1 Tax=Streptomyces sp. NPDC098781 TaxID=3366097 RepID=UPI00380BB47F
MVGFTESGAYAQYCTARVEALADMPEGVSFESAAALPVALETGTRGLGALGVRPGWTVVVHGAAGVVGSAVVQLLTARGVTVIGTASAPNHGHVASLGAIPVAHGNGVAAGIRRHAPRGVDAVYDAAGRGFARTAIELTGDPRRVLTIADFEAASLGIRTSTGSRTPSAEPIAAVPPLVASGAFRVVIDSVHPLTEIAAAHLRGEQGRPRGMIVVFVQEQDRALPAAPTLEP